MPETSRVGSQYAAWHLASASSATVFFSPTMGKFLNLGTLCLMTLAGRARVVVRRERRRRLGTNISEIMTSVGRRHFRSGDWAVLSSVGLTVPTS